MDEKENVLNASEDQEVKPEVTEEVKAAEEVVSEQPHDLSDLDDLTEEEKAFYEMVNKAQKTNIKIGKATRERWKELNEENKIVTEFGESVVEADSVKIKEDLVNLTASLQSKRILKGTITGVRSVNPENGIATYLAEVAYGSGGVKVVIPSYALFAYDIKKYVDAGTQNAIATNMQEMIGAEISFIVRNIDKDKLEVIADRLYALQEEGYLNYIKLQRDGKPRVTTGCLAQGKVLRSTKYSVTVSVLGVDCTIRKTENKDEISYNYIDNCRDVFKPGDDVVVKVLGIQRVKVPVYNNTYALIKGDFSIKQTRVNPMDKYFDEFAEGGRYSVVVQAVTDYGVFCEFLGKGVSCLAGYPRYGSMPEKGETRIVRITDKNDGSDGKGKRIYGVFVG